MGKGKLYTVNINRIKELDDDTALKIFGVRIAKFMPQGWVLKQELAPVKTLLFSAKALERKGEWGKKSFLEFYIPNYLNGIRNNDKALAEIREIANSLNNGQNVYYACYCNNHSLCHRSIVGDIFERNGYAIDRK